MTDSGNRSARLQPQPKLELLQLLLSSDHDRRAPPKGKSDSWGKHFQDKQHPTRPQTARRPIDAVSERGTPPGCLPASPRLVTAASPASTPRCRSAGAGNTKASPSRTRPALSLSEHLQDARPSFKRPLASTASAHAETPRAPLAHAHSPEALASRQVPVRDERGGRDASGAALEVNPRAREHVEVKACMLAYMHRINVDELRQLKERAQQELERVRLQRFVTRSGIAGDGSEFDAMRRKTSFLLRHFFSLDDGASQQQERLLYDIVDDWLCRDSASPDEVAALWTSITRHIEQSYILRRKLVAASDPNRLSVAIALDCLKKLAVRLPEYQRVLDVVVCVLESGLFVRAGEGGFEPMAAAPPRSSDDRRANRQRFYFEECQALERALDEAHALAAQTAETRRTDAQLSVRKQIERLLPQLREDEPLETEELFLALLRSNMELLACLACGEVLKHFFQREAPATKKSFFYDMFLKLLDSVETQRVLREIAAARLGDFRAFVRENLDAMDAILMDASLPLCGEQAAALGAGGRPAPTTKSAAAASQPLFQRLIERHPSEFAAVLWHSPFLTAQIFQASVCNILLVSQVLLQRSDVLLALLHHTLRDSAAVLEEFVASHPRALAELLANRPAALADAVKANPTILSETVSYMLKTTPKLLTLVLHNEPSLLALAFALAPQLLSETLENHPEFLLDVALRRPALVTRLFATHPDLLMAPLEANPTLFSSFLVRHRAMLPDLSAPDFHPLLFQLESTKFVTAATQTSTRLMKSAVVPLRIRELLQCHEEDMLTLVRTPATVAVTAATVATDDGASASPSRKKSAMATPDAPPPSLSSDDDASRTAVLLLLSPSEVVREIARLYVAKVDADARDDSCGRERQELSVFAKAAYLVELGFTAAAHAKLASLVRCAVRDAAGHSQEKVRIQWFLRFVRAAPARKPTPMRLHRVALDFYLLVLQRLIPREELQLRLGDEPYHACLVAAGAFRELVDEPLVSRLLTSPAQRQQLLVLQVSERDAELLITPSGEHSGAGAPPHAKRRDSTLSVQLQHAPADSMLHVDDVLDATMRVWLQHQARVREEWSVLFQRANPDGSGVIHFGAFAALVRSHLEFLDDRQLVDVFHSCGEENELGEFALLPREHAKATH
ncbi:hypothetical protein PybrP1_003175 [[Pythium] brassicae (nom. inval.)]|nr:hypothetical protein PybrP1_003175 [[Pythium] brassicae (nom. inval.)]